MTDQPEPQIHGYRQILQPPPVSPAPSFQIAFEVMMRDLLMRDAEMRAILPPLPAGYEWRSQISTIPVDGPGDAISMRIEYIPYEVMRFGG